MPDDLDLRADLAPAGVLRVSINLGNPVLAQGTPTEPRGVSVDLARDIAQRLDLPVEFLCFPAARESFAAVRDGAADLCFLAIDPARTGDIAFTAPYLFIEGAYAARAGSGIATADEVDRPGVRVGVKEGSAYDLFLSRALTAAAIVRGDEGATVADEHGLEIAAGIRTPLTAWVAEHPGWAVLEPGFMQIRQAIGVPSDRQQATVDWLIDYVEACKSDGFVSDALARSGRADATVAPPA